MKSEIMPTVQMARRFAGIESPGKTGHHFGYVDRV